MCMSNLHQSNPIPLDTSGLRQLWMSLQIKGSNLLLFSATCACCSPIVKPFGGDYPYKTHKIFDIEDLNPKCVVCDVISQTYNFIFKDHTSQPGRVRIDYSGNHDHLPIDFLYNLDSISQEKTHVQLYSQEPRHSSNPFPVTSSEVCLDTDSFIMTSRIQEWIDTCIKDHVNCIASALKKGFVPKRLIQIDPHSCRLVSPTSPVRYAALSYCWGLIQQPSTKKINVDVRYDDLPSHQLPQTIKDAITISRLMGLHYLWIDSICIIQDDREEWAEQAAEMADIYSGAYIVLAATGVSNATDGFLRQRSRPMKITSLACNPQHPITVNARLLNNHTIRPSNMDVIDNQPLSKRGWALQERALATRTVHFLPDEIMFECRSGLACECGRLQKRTNRGPLVWPPRTRTDRSRSCLNVADWMWLVETFKSRCLTYSDDALPALSGLAQRTLGLNPGQYLAGIWEKDIADQLSYRGKRAKNVAIRKQAMGHAPRLRPSFTWATFSGPIVFHGPFDQPICTFFGGQVLPVAGDLYGQVKEGFIRLKGRSIRGPEMVHKLLTATPSQLFTRADLVGFVTVFLDDIGQFSAPLDSSVWYEGLDIIRDWSAVVCFGLGVDRRQETTMLLLEPSHEEDAFVRIGLVASFPSHWFDEFAKESLVTIV
ncbi:heterokaryon incompatibility protein [Stagonosporopsis vannaccii]|nr:heterokaryon incompatibility protein [Stagonosporopsis vannaccii]